MNADKNDNQLEYNDGLGDLLREKEEYEFSWAKTSIVLISVIAIIFLGLTFVFKLSKNYLTNSMVLYEEQSVSNEDLKYIENNTELIKTIESKQDVLPLITENKVKQKEQVIKKEAIDKKTPKVNIDKSTAVKYKPVNTSDFKYKVISGTYSSRVNANEQKKRLQQKSFSSYVWTEKKSTGKVLFKVQAGAFDDYSLALKQKAALKRQGFDSYILIK